MRTARFRTSIPLRLAPIVLSVALILPGACTPVPTGGEVKDMIARYFDERGYTVHRIEIGRITPTPLGEKTYMGRKGYTIGIESIALVPKENIGPPWNYTKGKELDFRNAIMRVRERPGGEGGWDVEVVSGIPVF